MRKTRNLFGSICLILIGILACNANPLRAEHVPDSTRKATIDLVSDTYSSQIGVRELTGRNDGVQVEKYLASTGFRKGNPWCAAFVTWCFDFAGVDALHNAWAPSWFPPGKTIYTKGKANSIKPDKADVFGIWNAELKRIGHVGFVDDWPPQGEYAITVEGNTNNAGSREGDGVYRKRRPKSNIYKVSRWV